MRQLMPSIEAWHQEGRSLALATVVKAWGSAPRPLGAQMVVTDRGQMAGSVSGGCVEGAVVETAIKVIADGQPRLESYGISNDDAFAIGLSCGGSLDVLIEPLDDLIVKRLALAMGDHRLIAFGAVLPTRRSGSAALDRPDNRTYAGHQLIVEPPGAAEAPAERNLLDDAARELAAQLWLSQGAGRCEFELAGEDYKLFLQVLPPAPRLIIVGAVHVAVALVTMAKVVGFETIVIDPRTAFATEERFHHADQLMHEWPDVALRSLEVDANTFVALLSHDLKLDIPALEVALPRARYVGALGSRKTQAKRLAAMTEAGIDRTLAERIHNPIGLDLGGRRAEEIAVSVLAQMVAVSHGKDARPLPANR